MSIYTFIYLVVNTNSSYLHTSFFQSGAETFCICSFPVSYSSFGDSSKSGTTHFARLRPFSSSSATKDTSILFFKVLKPSDWISL